MQWNSILVQYTRTSGTVVIAVLVRLTLDSLGIVLAGLDPEKENFWFANCDQTSCVVMGITELSLAMVGASAFVWNCHEYLADSWLRRYLSLGLIIGAAEWMPISMLVAKTNMVMGYLIDSVSITPGGCVEAAVFALTLNTAAAAFTHYNLRERQEHTVNPRRFWTFTLLLILYALSWGVGWAYWDATLRFLKAFPESDGHAHIPILVVVTAASSIYLRYGPKPVVPQCGPETSPSFARSWISFMVYSSVVLLVMCLSDPTYGLLHLACRYLYPGYVFPHHTIKGFLLFQVVSVAWMLMSVSLSYQITYHFNVDMQSSSRLDRQKHSASFVEHQSNDVMPVTTVGCCLLYDVMALSTAFAWGQVATGGLSLFRSLIEYGAVPYLLIVVSYSGSLIFLIAWSVLRYCPSKAETQRNTFVSDSQLYTDISPRGEALLSPTTRFHRDFELQQNA